MDTFTIAIIGLLNVLCFVIGAKIGQTIVKGENVEMPNLNPVKAIKESVKTSKANKVMEAEQDKLSKILRNIERYDGTSKGQEDVR